MFSWIRKRATYANVALTLALVFAMTGGAYAAKKYLITSTKQISPSVLKQLVGKAGPAGANGKNGAPGAQGPQGPAGANGKDGTNGAAGQEGPVGPKGATGTAGAQGVKGTNGTTGPTGPAGVINTKGPLPVGQTETGAWAVGTVDVPKSKIETGGFRAAKTVASFPIPLAAALDESHVHSVNAEGEEFVAGKFEPATRCLGSVAAPTAPSGELCVYYTAVQSLAPPSIEQLTGGKFSGSTAESPGASTSGALIELLAGLANEPEAVSGWGSWAVTG